MNFIFRNYPSHPWIADWTFEPRGCHSRFRKESSNQFFRSTGTVGRITANVNNPTWVLQIQVPNNSRVNLLFNGFCAYIEKRKDAHGTEVIVPEPGVLWGRATGIADPVLTSSMELSTEEHSVWLENGTESAFLTCRKGLFCLVTKTPVLQEARHIADRYMEMMIEEAVQSELDHRSGVSNFFVEMSHHDSLAAICAESMMRALRPPEGTIPLSWSQTTGSETPQLNINELFPLALAWRQMNVKVAEELILCALKLQTNSGAIPVVYAPYTTHSVLESPKPLMAKVAESVWEVHKNETFLNTIIPLLRRHLQWMLHHFDPKRRGMHCWKNKSEAIVPDSYQTDMATVDLTALLLTEIEAFNRLCRASKLFAMEQNPFDDDRSMLESNLLDQYWNENDASFSNAFIRDAVVPNRGISEIVPLLWKKLPHIKMEIILDHIQEASMLPGGLNVLSWRMSALDDNSFPLMQQFLVYLSLKTADPNGTMLLDFSRVMLQGCVEWHTLSIERFGSLNINPAMGALIMNLQADRQYRYHGQGPISGFFFKLLKKFKADSSDVLIIVATLAAIFGVQTLYDLIAKAPPLDVLSTELNDAYAKRDIRTAVSTGQSIIRHYPDEASRARIILAGIYMLQGNPAEAGSMYEQVRLDFPDSPGPMIGLGLAYQLQERFEDAEKNYAEFCYLFDAIFPDVVTKINHFRYLMQEGFSAPPKWTEIYRYKLMHEL